MPIVSMRAGPTRQGIYRLRAPCRPSQETPVAAEDHEYDATAPEPLGHKATPPKPQGPLIAAVRTATRGSIHAIL
ncbi:hypothetical protein ACCO45_000958 [Purpureocillium lilacinum]|uniref:Uncharacterized protein n=1 Tax=Purpureocillium lilacinum TaxID=33203 RepID=A0ACC4E736_PURLI